MLESEIHCRPALQGPATAIALSYLDLQYLLHTKLAPVGSCHVSCSLLHAVLPGIWQASVGIVAMCCVFLKSLCSFYGMQSSVLVTDNGL